MVFAARRPEQLHHQLHETIQVEHPDNNTLITAPSEEHRPQRETTHLLELAHATKRDHANLLQRLSDA
ncbi:hypothetical protein [Nocardia wallacei]|uniref:hypothetical protein n=1 Tax=Nocardia wallacei TaxID=480035 RepID=UPI002454AC40|nr:hypothetical protein [Nocardia wallacei]